jgi:asparagine synthase (glutamine-hydrolysing)
LADHYADAIWHAEAPHPNGNAAAKFLLSRKVREHGVKVVLTGEGADEIFAGYAALREDARLFHGCARDDAVAAAGYSQADLTILRSAPPPSAAFEAALGFTPTHVRTLVGLESIMRPLLSDAFVRDLGQRDPFHFFLQGMDLRGLRRRSELGQSQQLWARSILSDIFLNHLGDRMEMAHSIEGRTPFLDHRVTELAAALPPDVKVRNGAGKWILREAARPYITEFIYRRDKHPFIAPPLLEGPFGEMVRDTLASDALDDIPFIDAARVRSVLDGLSAQPDAEWKTHTSNALTYLAGACVLQRRYRL